MSQTDQADLSGETTAVPPAAPSDVTAESSAADTGVLSATDAVLAALEPKAEATPASNEPGSEAVEVKTDEAPQDGATANEGTSGEDGEDKNALSEQEMAALTDKTRNRIHSLLDDRKALREEATTLKSEVEALKPKADGYEAVTEFMRENGLSGRDAAEAMRLAGLINRDPRSALEALKPIVAQLQAAAGEVLDADIAEDLRLGRITQMRANELSRARAEQRLNQQAQQRAETERQQREQDAEAQRIRDHVKSMATLGDELAAAKAQSDPDWKLKESLVVDRLKADLAANGVPKDAADLRKRFDDAVNHVTSVLRKAIPVPPPVNPSPPSASSSTGPKMPPPTDGVDAVMQALG